MRLMILAAALAVTGTTAEAAGGGKVKAGPKGIPFSCSDGRSLRVLYAGGGQNGKVKLQFDGSAAYELKAAPTPLGHRYAAKLEDKNLFWFTDGIQAKLSEASGGTPEQEIATCRRAGRDGAHHDAGHSADKPH